MNELKIKKGPILLPLILLVGVLTGYTLVNYRGVTAADSLDLGQQCLNNLDYNGAISAFSEAIELSPNNVEARVGLANAYAGTKDYEFAEQILEDVVYTDRPDEEAAAAMLQILRDSGQLPEALILVQILINCTDRDEYYELQTELLADFHNHSSSLAVGTDHVLCIQGGQLFGRGSNAMGQLGLNPMTTTSVSQMVLLDFPETPKKVSCVGRTSFVIDKDGKLWTAGENRWGQTGGGSAETVPESGWQQIPCEGSVAAVAGTTGRLLVLLTDGSVWSAGAGTGQSLQRMRDFHIATSIAANHEQVVLLTADGRLARSYSNSPDQWEMIARDVVSFSLSSRTLCWVDKDSIIYSDGYEPAVPSDWYIEDGRIKAANSVVRMASLGEQTLCTYSDGSLYHIMMDGTLKNIPCESPVVSLVTQGDVIVLEFANGAAAYWPQDATSISPVSSFELQ